MRILKSFATTLVVVLLVGGIFLYYRQNQDTASTNKSSAGESSTGEGIDSIVDGAKKKVVSAIIDEAIDNYVSVY